MGSSSCHLGSPESVPPLITKYTTHAVELPSYEILINSALLTLLFLLGNELLVFLVRAHHYIPHMDLIVGALTRTGRGGPQQRVAPGRNFRRGWLWRRFIVLDVEAVCQFAHIRLSIAAAAAAAQDQLMKSGCCGEASKMQKLH